MSKNSYESDKIIMIKKRRRLLGAALSIHRDVWFSLTSRSLFLNMMVFLTLSPQSNTALFLPPLFYLRNYISSLKIAIFPWKWDGQQIFCRLKCLVGSFVRENPLLRFVFLFTKHLTKFVAFWIFRYEFCIAKYLTNYGIFKIILSLHNLRFSCF